MIELDICATPFSADEASAKTATEHVFLVHEGSERIGAIVAKDGGWPGEKPDAIDASVLGLQVAWYVDRLDLSSDRPASRQIARLAIGVAQMLNEGHPWTKVSPSGVRDQDLDEIGMTKIGSGANDVRVSVGPIGVWRDEAGGFRLRDADSQGSRYLPRQ